MIIESVAILAGKLVDHFLPPSMSDAEREGKRQEAMALATGLALQEESGFREFILDYEGRADKMPMAIQVLRASVRPMLTYLLGGVTALLVWQGREIPPQLHQLDLLALGFWFGERAVRNYLKDKK